ncbi:Baeyer-Villiger monooxygenase [Fusarium oxysporum f. sp. albedinis]|nr:Baeyer-Villiger monooxygenase [Fusarium oxysporum f. sp. albedinis]
MPHAKPFAGDPFFIPLDYVFPKLLPARSKKQRVIPHGEVVAQDTGIHHVMEISSPSLLMRCIAVPHGVPSRFPANRHWNDR